MIPKVIHYCWFGGNEIPEKDRECILSWKKYMPDYEIKEWNEQNFDINCCQYVKDAYKAKKWAFVSDYARFWILYNFGGVYFDTDVEIIKSVNPILKNGPFMGLESVGNVNPGLGLAANSGMDLFKDVLEDYHNSNFFQYPGVQTDQNVVGKVTNILLTKGFDAESLDVQKVGGVTIYPPEFFCPMNYRTHEVIITDNTYSIHHYAASWITKEEKKIEKYESYINDISGLKKLGLRLKIVILKISNKYKNLGLFGLIKYIVWKVRHR